MRIKYIWQIAESVTCGKSDQEIESIASASKNEIDREINYLFANRGEVVEILNLLFGKKIPISLEFYKRLSTIQRYIGFDKTVYLLQALLWIEAYKLLSEDDALKLLQIYVEGKGVDIWLFSRSLGTFLSEVEIPSNFASKWFLMIGVKVKEDLMAGVFYEAVGEYAYNFPESGVKILAKFFHEGFDPLRLHFSAVILGSIRASSKIGRIKKEVIEKWEGKLIDNPRSEYRLCYHRSWIISLSRGVVTTEQLETILERTMEGRPEEVDEAFNIIYSCLRSQLNNKSFVNFAMQWFRKYTSNKISPPAKYCVAASASSLYHIDKIQERFIEPGDSDDLIIRIQPIEKDQIGTWRVIEDYMVKRLRGNKEEFYKLLDALSEVNPTALIENFKTDKFTYLESEMSNLAVGRLIIDLFFSVDENRRELAHTLFQKIKIDYSPEDVPKKTNQIQLRTILWEFMRRPFAIGADVSKFLVMLEPMIGVASVELRKEFENEMIRQAINYPGECLQNWKKIGNPSKMLKRVVRSAEKYFTNLKNISNSPAISFSFSGFSQAVQKGERDFSRKLSEGVREKSIFLPLVKKLNIIYGDRWSIMVRGHLDDPTPFKGISTSFEFPRLELIDPEGMVIRRLYAASIIGKMERNSGNN